MKPDIVLIETESSMEGNFLKKVEAIGMYKQLNVSHRQDRKVYIGRIYLLLSDNSTLVVEINGKGIRAKEEIERYENRKVKVNGILNEMYPLWGNGKESSVVSRYLSDIEEITIID